MKNLKLKAASTEVKCSACDGTGYPAAAQPTTPGRKIFPPACKRCFGKGRVSAANDGGRG
jgi:DnaJ-class molecular chaperone